MYPKNRNHCIQLYPKPQECVSHAYPKCSATCSVPQSFVPWRLFPRHDEAIIFEAALYQLPLQWDRVHGSIACVLWGVAKILFPFFHGFHTSHVYPKVPECVSGVYPINKSVHPVMLMPRTISTSGRGCPSVRAHGGQFEDQWWLTKIAKGHKAVQRDFCDINSCNMYAPMTLSASF